MLAVSAKKKKGNAVDERAKAKAAIRKLNT
jgi:hypothetical protein